MRLDEQLHHLLRRPEAAPWPDESTAYDRFLRRRRRRARRFSAGATVALAAVLAAGVAIPQLAGGLLPDERPPAGQLGQSVVVKGRLVRNQLDGYQLTVPAGWRVAVESRSVVLTSGSKRIEIDSGLMKDRFLGLQPPWPDSTPLPLLHSVQSLERSRGRVYFIDLNGDIALPWPAHCPAGTPCSAAAPYRAVRLHSSGPSADPAVHRIVESLQPIGNALKSVRPGDEQPDFPVGPEFQLGSGGNDAGTWTLSGHVITDPAYQHRSGSGAQGAVVWITMESRDRRDQPSWHGSRFCSGTLPLAAPTSADVARGRLVVGVAAKQVAAVRLEFVEHAPVTVATLGGSTPLPYNGYVSPLLPRGARLLALVPLDKAGQPIGAPRSPEELVNAGC